MKMTKRIENPKILFLLAAIVIVSIIFIPYNQQSYQSAFYSKSVTIKSNVSSLKKANWIIVTSVNEPTEQIKKLAAIEEFQLLVVGDTKTNQNWTHANSIFLSVADQEALGFRIYPDIPFRSYTRKNIGYLYAIRNGAKFIYDTDDDNAPIHNLMDYFIFDEFAHGLIFDCQNSTRLINPYAHFGQPLIWPRGYPLSEIHKNHHNQYICGKRKTSTVQQGVVNGDPDVDAIFRLTKTMEYRKVNITFDESSPSVQYPAFRMAPYNSQSTFFHYRAFWSLYLPTTVSFRLTDIWRSYWAQRLLWLLDDTVTFLGPNAHQIRNAHSYLKDFEDEKNMYSQTEALVDFLFEWRCHKDKFFECVIDLSQQMADHRFWEQEEVGKIKHWLSDLVASGYIEPEIVSELDTYSSTNQSKNCGSQSFQDISEMVHERKYDISDLEYFSVRYTPKFQRPIDLENYCCDGQMEEIYDRYDSLHYFENFCSKASVKLTYNTSAFDSIRESSSSDIDLLVTFNHEPLALNIETIQHFYKGHFRNIIFCGHKNISRILNENRSKFKRFDSFTFIDMNEMNFGYYHYYCMTKAIEINFNVKSGILLMSDDVLLKYWHLKKLDKSKIWFPEKILIGRDHKTIQNTWMWWNMYEQNVIELFQLVDEVNEERPISKNPVMRNYPEILPEHVTIIKNFHKQLLANRGNLIDKDLSYDTTQIRIGVTNDSVSIGTYISDIFYMPKSKLSQFHFLSDLFNRKRIFLEMAVPTILGGMTANTELQVITGLYPWVGTEIGNPMYKVFEKLSLLDRLYFAHPVKVNWMDKKRYCELMIQKIWIGDSLDDERKAFSIDMYLFPTTTTISTTSVSTTTTAVTTSNTTAVTTSNTTAVTTSKPNS